MKPILRRTVLRAWLLTLGLGVFLYLTLLTRSIAMAAISLVWLVGYINLARNHMRCPHCEHTQDILFLTGALRGSRPCRYCGKPIVLTRRVKAPRRIDN